MKNLLTLVAAIAITSAASAQSNTCSVKTSCGVKIYKTDSFVKASHKGKTVTVTDGLTGAVIETYECDGSGPVTTNPNGTSGSTGSGVEVNCGKSSSATPSVSTPPISIPTTTERPSVPDFSSFINSMFSEVDKFTSSFDQNIVTSSRATRNGSVAAPANTSTFSGSNGNTSFESTTTASEGGTIDVNPVFTGNGVSLSISASASGK